MVENIGGVALNNVNVSDYLTNGKWVIPILQPSEKKTFTTTYVIDSYDLDYRVVSNTVYSNGQDDAHTFVYDDDYASSLFFTPGFLDYKILPSPVTCGDGLGIINIEFQSGSQSGIYRLIKQEDGQEFSEYFDDKSSIKVEVPAGEYKLVIVDEAIHEHAVSGIFLVQEIASVDFPPPLDINACIQYNLFLEPGSTLRFDLRGPDGSIIRRDANNHYKLTKTGTYSLTGIDSTGVLCSVEKTFKADISHPSELELDLLPFCSEDVFTTIHLVNPTVGNLVMWYRIGSQGAQHLSDFDNHPQLTVQEDGEYEVTLTNGEECIIGKGRIQVARSFTEPPQLNQLYTICPTQGAKKSLTAGSRFIESLWYHDGVEVSNSPVFEPEKEGFYNLLAKDKQGCDFFVDFGVEYKCEPTISYPSAIMPQVPDKAFIVYPDNLTEELEVFIQNRWGETIFHCEDKYPINGKPSTCMWDGTINQTNVPNGSYMVTIRYKTKGKGLVITEKSTLTVLD